MADGKYTVHVGGTFDGGAFSQAEGALRRCDQSAAAFINTLKLGVGIDLGGRLVASVASLPGMFEQLVQRGVAFNAEMSDSEAAIAKIIGRFQGLNDVAAKNEAGKAMAQIAELEPKTAGTLQSLVQGFSATAASSLSAGLSIQENIDLVAKFANVASNIKLPQEQLPQELRSILSGNITADSAIAKTLQISNEDITKAKELGTLYQFLSDKIGTLGDAGDTNAVRMSSLSSAIDKLLASATKPIFDEINEGLVTLTEELNKPETADALKQLGHDIAGLVGDGVKLTAWAIENADALLGVARAAGVLVVAFAAMKLKELLFGLAGMTANLFRNTAALNQETAALARNTAAQKADAAARQANVSIPASSTMGRPVDRLNRALADNMPYSKDAYRAARSFGDSPADALAKAREAMMLVPKPALEVESALSKMGRGMENLRTNIGNADASMGGLLTWIASIAAFKAGEFAISQAEDLSAGIGASGDVRSGSGKADLEQVADLQKSQGEKINEFLERFGNIASEEGKFSLAKDIGDFQAQLSKNIDLGGNSRMSNEVSLQTSKQLSQLVDRLMAFDAVKAGSNAMFAAGRAREEMRAKSRNAADVVLEKGKTTRDASAESDALQLSAGSGNAVPIEKAIAEKNAEIARMRNVIAGAETPEAATSAAEKVNALEEQLVALKQLHQEALKTKADLAKEDNEAAIKRGDDNDDAAVKSLQDQQALLDAIAAQRIAQVEAAGGKETDIAAKRRAIEAEIAADRLATEDKIGLLQGESADAREARHVAAATADMQRATELARVSREKDSQRAEDAWQAGAPRDGRIDGRSQRTIGTGGELLMDKGVLQEGVTRSGLGTLTGPSMLDTFAAQTQARAALTPTSLLPPTTPPPPPAGQPGNANGQTGAQALNQAADKVTGNMQEATAALNKIAAKSADVVAAAKAAQTALEASGSQTVTAIQGIEKSAQGAGDQAGKAGAAAVAAIDAVKGKVADLEKQLDNLRE